MSFFRKTILVTAGNPIITKWITKHGMKLGANRFVAGGTIHDALNVVHRLNKEGLLASLDYLGENITNKNKATKATQLILQLLEEIYITKAPSNISVKLTQLGLEIDKDFCLQNIDQITKKAQEYNNFIRIDMEDSEKINDTLYIFQTLLKKYGKAHIGAVIQSYLYRSVKDISQFNGEGNIRIVKGAYKESSEVSFPKKQDVDKNYVKLVKLHLKNNGYVAIATHDESIINPLKEWIKENNIPSTTYEFQMLYGIHTKLQKKLVKEGYKVRTYIPFGKEWYAYFTRRIAERPANALFILRHLIPK